MKSDSLLTRQRVIGLSLAGLAVLVVVAGLLTRRSLAEHLNDGAAERAVPTVTLLAASALSAAPMELSARIEPWARAPIYARTSGYLKSWTVDIGGAVKTGQLLGTIETPDLDQQLLQARAELATARSNLALSSSTAKRWQALLASDSVSRQEADEKAGDLAARQSVVNAMQANVDRVQALQGYTRLVAPFDGVVTERNTDVGALISIGGAPGSALFVVSDIHKLRVYVNVPQRQVAMVRSGGVAQLSVPERPGRTYTATVQSLARAISAGSGTMLVQLSVDNDAGELLPGGYATVRFDAPAKPDSGTASLTVPPGALMFGKNGTQVATVDGASRVLLKRVTVARDMGNVIELAGGIDSHDRVIDSPPDGIANGDLVRVATTAGAARKATP